MLSQARISKLLLKHGFTVNAVYKVPKNKTKVCRVELVDQSSAMLKIWPFYPLRFAKIRFNRQWWADHRWKCSMPFNEVKYNHIIRTKVNIPTPDIYCFSRIFPHQSIRYGYMMLQENLKDKGFEDLEDVLIRLIAQKNYNAVFALMEKVAQVLETIFSIGVYNEDPGFKNFMVNERLELALIDFERFFSGVNARDAVVYKDQILESCIKNFKKMTYDDPAFYSGLDPFIQLKGSA